MNRMTEHSQETKIAILEAKVEHMMGHVKELTLRVRANEKVVASVSLLGVIACTFVGAGYFAPKANSSEWPSVGEMVESIRESTLVCNTAMCASSFRSFNVLSLIIHFKVSHTHYIVD